MEGFGGGGQQVYVEEVDVLFLSLIQGSRVPGPVQNTNLAVKDDL